MNVQWYAHLPSVVLEGSEGGPIGLGQVVRLPINEWRKLDSAFPYNDRNYERSQPVFYTGEADLLDGIDTPDYIDLALRQVSDWVNVLYLAFLLDPYTPLLPPPQMSVTYVRIETPGNMPAQPLLRTVIGPFEREWIVFGNRTQEAFDDARFASVRRAYDLLATFNHSDNLPGVEAGLDTLELTARPEFWWDDGALNLVNQFIHCMAALEHILLPAKEEAWAGMKLTPTFGQHAAVFTSPSRDDLQERTETFSSLYRLRSRLVHGEIGISDLSEEERSRLGEGRQLLRYVLRGAMALGRAPHGEESLPQLLAQAYKKAEVHQGFLQQLEEVNYS